MIPSPPRSLTPAMHRYLLHHPSWVSAWIERHSGLLLMPEHYLRIGPVLDHLNSLQSEQAEGIALNEYCQLRLLAELLGHMPSSIPLVTLLAENYICLSALIQLVSE
jgi:hypothetical protein